MENIPKGMQMVIVSFFCLFVFSSKIQKHPPHPPAFAAVPCGAEPWSCCSSALPFSSMEQLSAPDGSLSFGGFFIVETESDDLKTNNSPWIQRLVPNPQEDSSECPVLAFEKKLPSWNSLLSYFSCLPTP